MAVAAVFVVALVVELLAGVAISRPAWPVIGAVAALIAVANIGDMRSAAGFLRDQGLLTRTGLAALEIARPVARPDEPISGIGGYPLVVVRAGQYFRLERDLGSPATSAEELAGASESRPPRGGRRAHEIPSRRPDADHPIAGPRRRADGRCRRRRPCDAVRRLRRVRAQRAPGRPRRSRRSS